MTRPRRAAGGKRGKHKPPPPPVRPLTAPLSIVVTGKPITKKNSAELAVNRKTGSTFIVPSRQYRQWARDTVPQVQPVAYQQGAIEQPVCLTAVIYRERRVGDLVNYLQAVCDLLQDAGMLVDDKWVESFDGSRLDCDKHNPRIELTLTPLGGARAA